MKTIFKNMAVAVSAIAATLAICLGIMAWSEPSTIPPEGNIAAPINTSSTQQTKTGPLGIKLNDLGYWISQVGQSLAFFNSDSSGNPKTAQMVIGQDGNVGIGTEVPGKKLVVGGAAQAAQFCLNNKCCSTWEECGAGGKWIKIGLANYQVTSFAASADGTKIMASSPVGGIYLSADYGTTWSKVSDQNCISLAASADGAKFFCGVNNLDNKGYNAHKLPDIRVSTDLGTTWSSLSQQFPKPQYENSMIGFGPYGLAVSFDGTKILVDLASSLENVSFTNSIMIFSDDAGKTWKKTGIDDYCRSIAVSPDGTKFAAAGCTSDHNSVIHIFNGSWKTYGKNYDSGFPIVDFSSDGRKVFASYIDSTAGESFVYVSDDYGTTWNPITNLGVSSYWGDVFTSIDGSKIVLVRCHDGLFNCMVAATIDSGVTWQTSGSSAGPDVLADVISVNNTNKLIGIDSRYNIWTYQF